MTKLEEIKSKADIVEIIGNELELIKKGQNYWALCPFHQDTNPSMSISSSKQIYKCFTCNAGGDVIKFISDYKKLTFKEAMQFVAKLVGVEYTFNNEEKIEYDQIDKELIEAMRITSLYTQNAILSKAGSKALEYLTNRGIDKNILDRFLIGFQPDDLMLKKVLLQKNFKESTLINASLIKGNKPFFANRVIFPIKNIHGDIVAFSGRTISENESVKYLNSIESKVFDKSSTLYNYFDSKSLIKRNKEVIITEGFMDVIALYKVGIENAVSIMGTALTPKHINILKGLNVILMLDGDQAGIKATMNSIELLMQNNIKTNIIELPEGKDADDLLQEGFDVLKDKVEHRIGALEFVFKIINKLIPNISPADNEKYISLMSRYLKYATDLEKDFFINKISQLRSISIDILERKFQNKQFDKTRDITNEVKEQYTNKKERPVISYFKKRNYEYELINSMIHHPKLIRVYEKSDVIHNDAILLRIAKYLVSVVNNKENIEASVEIKDKMKEIKESGQGVSDDVTFEELIKRVSKQSLKEQIQKNKDKIKESSDNEEKVKLVELNKKLNKKMKGL